MAPPQVSVVVPTRDRQALLATTLRTVLWQRGVHLEAIVVDDGSTEDTAAVVAGLADPRVRLVRHEQPCGVSAARNRGIAEATGEWIAFCDDDDLWAPDKLSLQLAAARATGRVWVYGGAFNMDNLQQARAGVPPPEPETLVAGLARNNTVTAGASNVLVRADTLAGVGGFDTGLRHAADWDMWLRLARTGLPARVGQPIVAYRMHPGNASLDTRGMLAELDEIERRHGVAPDRSRHLRYLARLLLRVGQRRLAFYYLLRAALVERGDSTAADLWLDLRRLAEHAEEVIRRRLGLPRAAGTRRAERARRADPHRAYKAEAQSWLDMLPSS